MARQPSRDLVDDGAVHINDSSIHAVGGGNVAIGSRLQGVTMTTTPAPEPTPPPPSAASRVTIAFLAFNPPDQPQLRLDEEVRGISQRIRSSEHRDVLHLVSCWALQPLDLLQALNEHRPQIVHVSGHGTPTGELALQSAGGGTARVSTAAVVSTLDSLAVPPRLAFFNACFSSGLASAVLAAGVDVAIGMRTAIGDEAARVFAAQLYSAIGFGHPVSVAFKQARSALLLSGIREEDTPQLVARAGLDPRTVVLVRAAADR